MNSLFDQLYKLYEEYNSHTNISAIRNKDDVYEKHFRDSIAILDYIDLSGRLIDIGTGGGFPSLALAIEKPELDILAIDSANKKITFVNMAIKELGLKKLSTKTCRAEDLGREPLYRESYDYAVSRAVAELRILLELASPFVKKGGKFIAYKKSGNDEEINLAKKAMKETKLKLVKQIDYDRDKQFLVFEKTAILDKKLPRNYQQIKKRPL